MNVFSLHKPIRNKLRKYHRDTTLKIIMPLLLQNEMNVPHFNGYLPWECMLLIRWVLQYGNTHTNAKEPSLSIVKEILNEIRSLTDSPDLALDVTNPYGVHKFMRRTAFQQFTYQMQISEMGWRTGRQLILFTEIGENFNVNHSFKKETGLSIKEFLQMSLALFSILQANETDSIKATSLHSIFDKTKVQRFFDLISVSPEEAKIFLDNDAKNKQPYFILQLYELSPLYMKPFLRLGEYYTVFSKRLFRQFMANFVYDFLYSLPDSFNSFGDILERYIRVRIEECGFNPVLDKTWKKILKKSISAPDFTLSEENATIFIEVKRKHLPEIPKIIQSNDSFSRHLDDSIVKGVIQIYSLANELVNQKPNQINNFENFFGIVVTYKDDYLRGGQQFWDEFLRDQVTARLKDKDIDPYIIPPENIFVLPVDDIDYLLAFILDYPDKKISEVLKQVIEYEADVNRSSFFFRDHLSRMSKSGLSRPNHLWNKTKNMMDELTQKMQNFENNHRK